MAALEHLSYNKLREKLTENCRYAVLMQENIDKGNDVERSREVKAALKDQTLTILKLIDNHMSTN